MLVLESGPTSINSSPTNMLTPNGSQYLQPDYLSPLPSSLDSKRSPLALLAQTCSQIGADPPSTKPEKSRSKDSSSSTSSSSNTLESVKTSSKTPPTSQHKSHDNHKSSDDYSSKSDFKSPIISSSKTVSSSSVTNTTSLSSSSATETRGTESKSADSTSKPALDSLQGLPKDVPLGSYRPPNMFGSLAGLSPYPGLDPATAAALGLGAAGAFRHPYPHLGSLPGYPPVSLGLGLSASYSGLAAYGRLKGVNGSDPLMSLPVCRDPYCTGCPSSMLGLSAASPATSAATSGVCPAGCTQCDHQKIMPNSTAPTTSTTVATSSASSPFSPTTQQRPYVCNWIAGDNYCGKRFGSSEELLQHLRSHTSLSVPTSEATSSFSALLNPSLHPHSHLLNHRTYPTPPLSPLSMARYHPYSKPGAPAFTSLTASNPLPNPLASLGSANPLLGLGSTSTNPLGALGATPSSLSGSPFPPNHLSPYAAAAAAAAAAAGLPGVGAYYSNPYSFYGQRLGASVLP